jgi:hypothetical protein
MGNELVAFPLPRLIGLLGTVRDRWKTSWFSEVACALTHGLLRWL